MINLISNKDNSMKSKIEYLLGKEIPLTNKEINSLAHLTFGNLWVFKVLDKLGLTIDDVIYEKDRKKLIDELSKENKLMKS